MKKSLAFIVASFLVGSTITFAATTYFSDVTPGSWYEDSVVSLTEKGILKGYPDQTFRPSEPVNRAELAVTLDRLITHLEQDPQIAATPWCNEEPETTAIGSTIHPIAPQYQHLEFLGQIFTAAECDNGTLEDIFGVEGETYTLGSRVDLKNNASTELRDLLWDIEYSCNDDESCYTFSTNEDIKITDLLKLAPFADQIERDDCVNCG
jgi:hypothetical protein